MFSKIKRFYSLWKNPIFQTRYVERNIIAGVIPIAPIVSWERIAQKIKDSPWKIIYWLPFYIFWRLCDDAERRNFSAHTAMEKIKKNPLNIFLFPVYLFFFIFHKLERLRNKNLKKLYIFYRLWNNKIDIPQTDFMVTFRCTLRCEACRAFVPYFTPQTADTCTLESFKQTLGFLLKNVASIRNLYLVGGEPLMFKELDKIVEYLNNETKVISFTIITNATIKPKENLLKALVNARAKSQIIISDYSKSPNIHTKLQADEITKILEENKIQWTFWHSGDDAHWIDPGKIYKRNRDKTGIIKNFKNCLIECAVTMSNALNNNGGGGNSWFAESPLPSRV